jgi:hypothetical protein
VADEGSGWNHEPTGYSGHSGHSGFSGPTGTLSINDLVVVRKELEELDKKLSRPLCTEKHKKCGCEKMPKKPFLQRIWNGYVGLFRKVGT